MIRADLARARIEALPLLDFGALFGAGPVLVLAPHQDDESLACGGMLAEAAARGVAAHVAFLTDGGMSHPGSPTWPRPRLVAERRAEALRATAILGVPPRRVAFLDQPDGAAPHDGPAFAAALDRLCALLRQHAVATLCASWVGDPHGDHGSAARLAAAAASSTGAHHLAYPVWAWTVPDAAPLPPVAGGARLDMGRHLATKRRAIAAHATQHRGLIDDDPAGFHLPDEFLGFFNRDWEAFLEPP